MYKTFSFKRLIEETIYKRLYLVSLLMEPVITILLGLIVNVEDEFKQINRSFPFRSQLKLNDEFAPNKYKQKSLD